jgi:putative membrane protein
MRRFLWRCLLNVLSLFLAAAVIPGIDVADVKAGVCAGLLLGLVNLLLRPLLLLVTLPVNLLTLGIFTVVIDSWMVMLTDGLSAGITIPGFWEAVVTALFIYGMNLLLRDV